MKKLLEQYAAYNLWANQRVVDAVVNLSDEQLHKTIPSSFDSIYKTVVHLWDIESIWWQRLKLSEQQEWPGSTFKGSIMQLGDNLIKQSKQWQEWIAVATEAALNHEFIYKNSKKDSFKQPVSETVHHLFNHQSFHRGQLITLLRQAGFTALPGTDLISFLRKK